jgi:hypothetical protein
LPDVHILDIGIFGLYEQIVDALLGYLSELPDIHSTDIGLFGPYALTYDEEQGYFS